MSKPTGVTGVLGSILVGAIVWFILQVIIGVLAWVSVVAGGVVAIVGVLMALGMVGAHAASRHHGRDGSMLGSH